MVDNQALEYEKTGLQNQGLKVIDNEKETRLQQQINFASRKLT